MDDNLDQAFINFLTNGELGENIVHLIDIIEKLPGNQTFVDIGVESGKSSKVLLHKSLEKNNKVYGIDTITGIGIGGIMDHPNYTFVREDSVAAGANWKHARPTIVFVDSVHVKPQVMRELYYWWDLLEVGGYIVFHDTEWGMNKEFGYIHKADHPCAGKKPGNTAMGYDFYAGRGWETPEYALYDFFKLALLNTDNKFLKSVHYPPSLGMTFISKKKEHDYKALISPMEWDRIEMDRQSVLKSFI